jgi:hypothetical protein
MKTQTDFESLINQNLNLLDIEKNQIEIFGEGGQVQPGSNKENEQGLHYLDFEYRQILVIENMPIQSLALLTLISHYFVNGLGDRDGLESLGIEFGPHNQGQSLDIEITFGVREPVYLVEALNSPIEFGGKKWAFGEHTFFIADQLANFNVND